LTEYLSRQHHQGEHVFLCVDIEVASNVFLIGFGHKEYYTTFGFEAGSTRKQISSVKDHVNELIEYCEQKEILVCGANLFHYDLILLKYFLDETIFSCQNCKNLYNLSNEIIQTDGGKYKYLPATNKFFGDLLTVDVLESYAELTGKARMGLKQMAVLEGLPNVLILSPWKPKEPILLPDGISSLIAYNHSDIRCIVYFAEASVREWCHRHDESVHSYDEIPAEFHAILPRGSKNVLTKNDSNNGGFILGKAP